MSLHMIDRPRTSRRRDRVDTIHEMLRLWDKAQAQSSAAGGGSGSQHTSRINTWDPQTFTREFQELDRCLAKLRYLAAHGRPMIERNVSSSSAWWHLRHRYFETQVVRREVHMRKTNSGERLPMRLPENQEIVARTTILHGKTSYMMVRVWDPRVQPAVVGAALRWIAIEYKGTPAVYSESAA